ncbi:hypothetical protein KKB18_08660, partial [bacterium]|nr:hypothetical protein [bacterium]
EVTNLDSKYAYIKHISVDSKGIVWASIRGGAAWFDGKKWSQYYWDKETIKYDVFNSVEDNEGKIWFAASVNGLYRYDDETFTKVPEYEDSKVLWVEKAPRGGVWVGTEESLEHFDGTTRTPYIIPNQLPISNETTAVTFDQEGNLWCGDYYGDLALLHGNEWKLFRGNKITETESGSTGKLNCLLASNINGLWTAFDFDVLNYKDETWTNFMDELEPEIGFGYHDLAEDPSGNIWVSAVNVSSGLARWNGSSWEFHKPKDGVPQNKNVMCFDNEGKLWLVTVGSLYSYDNIEWKQVKIFSDKNFPIKYFNGKSISAFNNGTVWVGGWGGIVVFKDGEIVNSFTSENGLPKLPEGRMIVVQGIKQAPDGTKWINTDNGFVHYDGTQFKTYTEEDAGFYFGGNDFAIDPIGRIFFVSNGGGLTEFTPTSVTMKMSLSTDNISYKRSDNFSLKLSVKNNGPDETGDFYFVMLTPDGTIYSALDWSKSIHPAASNITIPAGFTLPLLDVVSVTLPSSNPPISMPGKYYFAIGLADTGTGYFRSKAITSLDVRE